MPELEYLLDDSIHVEPYPYNRTFDQAKHHPCMIIHTPGPHGLPKPVIWTHWAFTTIDAQRMVPELDGRPSFIPKLFDSCDRSFWGYPVFHGPGIIMSLSLALYSRSTSVLGPPGIPTAATLEQIIDYGRIDAANLSPSSLEDIAASPSTLAKLQRLKFITFGEGEYTPSTSRPDAKLTPPRYSITPRRRHHRAPHPPLHLPLRQRNRPPHPARHRPPRLAILRALPRLQRHRVAAPRWRPIRTRHPTKQRRAPHARRFQTPTPRRRAPHLRPLLQTPLQAAPLETRRPLRRPDRVQERVGVQPRAARGAHILARSGGALHLGGGGAERTRCDCAAEAGLGCGPGRDEGRGGSCVGAEDRAGEWDG